jgi:hypothetical protein
MNKLLLNVLVISASILGTWAAFAPRVSAQTTKGGGSCIFGQGCTINDDCSPSGECYCQGGLDDGGDGMNSFCNSR